MRRSRRRRRTVTAYRERGRIVVLVPAGMSAAEETRWVTDMVARVTRREARGAVPDDDAGLARRAEALLHAHLDPMLDPAPRPRSVRWVDNQHHRWGSCTPARGDIRLSRRLQQLPDWVGDYVLGHELVHLVRPHHDAEFWALVGRLPRAEEARGFLQGWSHARAHPPD